LSGNGANNNDADFGKPKSIGGVIDRIVGQQRCRNECCR